MTLEAPDELPEPQAVAAAQEIEVAAHDDVALAARRRMVTRARAPNQGWFVRGCTAVLILAFSRTLRFDLRRRASARSMASPRATA